ncbi:MAG: DUF2764 family protein [Eubacterium sp.]|nr:DUF2764 family protein [Eubacterium sp.]
MASYYYLIASLPDLKSDGEMPLSYEEFLASCKGVVPKPTYDLLENLDLSSTKGPLLKEWAKSYGVMTDELNEQRRARLGKGSKGQVSGHDDLASQAATSALAAKNPLEAEKILLDYQFRLLDELVGFHTFDDYVLFGYAIKLKLLERQACFVQEKGSKEFRRLLGDVQQRVYSI